MTDPLTDALSRAPYLQVGTPITPKADFRRLDDGSWLVDGPPVEYEHAAEAPLAYGSLLARRDNNGPMMAQRGPEGAWHELSWAQAWTQSRALASALLSLGHGPARPIAALSGNSLELWILRLAAMQAGIPMVHLSPAWSLVSRDHAQLRAALALVPCSTLFVQDGADFGKSLAAVCVGGITPLVISVSNPSTGHLAFGDLLQQTIDEGTLAAARSAITPQSWCAVYFTSGSTGQPKAVPITHGMIAAQQRLAWGRTPPGDRRPQVTLDWLPWHHVFAGVLNLNRLLAVGGTYYIDDGRPMPGQYAATLRNLREVAPTSFASTPLAFGWLARELENDKALARHFFSRLEVMAYGGAGLAADTWQRLQRLAVEQTGHKIVFRTALGGTETTGIGTAMFWPTDDIGNIGLPLPEVQLRLVPLEGQRDLTGRFELRMRGPNVFAGYIGRPDLSAQAFDEQGFYRLGDAVQFLDSENALRGLRFDGRVGEDFKLESGTWVRAGALRLQALSLLSPLISDAVVCGRDRSEVGVLVWPVEGALRALDPTLAPLPLPELLRHPVVLQALTDRLNAAPAQADSMMIRRAALLSTPPSLDAGEITDKGYVNQAAALRHRAVEVERLYAGGVEQGVALSSRR